MDDRLKAFGAGAGQAATAGWQDEAVAKLLSAFPVDDGTGIPRQYAAGSAEEDLKKTFRAEDADLQRRFPANYTAGSLVGAAPAAIATGGAGGLGAVAGGAGLGALSGAGFSENKGAALAKDAIRGGAIGGGAAAAGNAASSAAKIAAPVLSRLWKQGPPPSAPQPAMATAGAGPAPRPQAPAPRPQMNMSEAMPSSPPANVPPRRDSLPAMAVPQFPKPGKVPNISDAEMDVAEQRLRQTEASWAKKHDARFNPEAQKIRATGTARPPRRPKGDAPALTGAAKLDPARYENIRDTVQQTLPQIPEPQFNYHATPQSNARGIAELGLRPEQGGKNFDFGKNRGRVYMSGPDEAEMWAQKLRDFSGEEPLQLRTTAPVQPVPGAAEAVKIRTEPVPPERIQYRSPSGSWKSVRELRPKSEAPPANMADQLRWWAAMMAGPAAAAANRE